MVVHQFTYRFDGGAGVAMRRLHRGLRQLGVDSHVWFGLGEPEDAADHPQTAWYRGLAGARWRAGRILQSIQDRVGLVPRAKNYFTQPRQLFPTPPPPGSGLGGAGLGTSRAVVHLHWVSLLLDYPSFFRALDPGVPLVWTCHDLNPMTGGCHYTGGCRRFESGCGECPVLERSGSGDLSARSLRCKVRCLEGFTNLHVVGDSRWVESEARRSRVFRNARSFRTIHYGLDDLEFSPGDRGAAREALGLGASSFVVGFGAFQADEPRKGGRVLREALAGSERLRGAEVVVFGHGGGFLSGLPQRVVEVGATAEPGALARVYRALDVFVMPSLEEAFGQTALESLACGTPVVGSDTGGIPDMVHPGRTGLLAKPGDSGALGAALEWMAAHPTEREAMGRAGRELVTGHFTLRRQAEEYRSLYQEIVEEGHGS